MTTVWICARAARCIHDKRPLEPGEPTWDLIGIFSSHDLAAAQCRDCRYSIVPLPVDTPDTNDGRTTCIETVPGHETPCRVHYTAPVQA